MPAPNVNPLKALDIVGILLCVPMVIAWLLSTVVIVSIVNAGPAIGGESRMGRGWELLWAFALSFLVWSLLGGVLHRLQLPSGMWIWGLSALATASAFFLFGDGVPRWPGAVPILLPALLLSAALSERWASLRISLLVVAALPCVVAAATVAHSSFQNVAASHAVRAEVRDENLHVIAGISEDQPLWQWLPQLKEESGVREETLAVLRKLNRRQGDVETMLAAGRYEALDLMPLLDLRPSPRLQQLVDAWAVKDAAYARTKPGGGDEILERTFFYTTLPALHWLHDHGQKCPEGVSQLKSAALEYKDTPIRRKFIKELDSLLN